VRDGLGEVKSPSTVIAVNLKEMGERRLSLGDLMPLKPRNRLGVEGGIRGGWHGCRT